MPDKFGGVEVSSSVSPTDKFGGVPVSGGRTFSDAMPSVYAEGDPNLSLSDLGEAAKGFASHLAGLPGDVYDQFRQMVKSGIPGTELFQKPTDLSVEPSALSSDKIEKAIFGAAPDKRAAGYRELGGLVGDISAPAVAGKAAEGVAKGLPEAVKIGGRLLLGATSKAQEAVTEIGTASDKSVLGSKMFTKLKGNVNDLLAQRSKVERELRAKYLSEGVQKEKEIASSYKDYLGTLEKGHPIQRSMIEESAKNLGENPSIDTLVIERRRLNDIASGASEGFQAVQKNLAGEMANNLTNIIREKVPSYGEYIDAYAKNSAPINLFEDTAIGKRVTKETSEFLPDIPHYDPATLPKNAFQTKRSVEILRQLSGGDDAFVNAAAGEHAASELKDLNATQARAWLTKNKEWLDEVPSVRSDVEKYVTNLEKVSHTQEKAKKIALGAGAVGLAPTVYHNIRNFVPGLW